MDHLTQKADAVLFSGRTFASFFKERYKGDTYSTDFSASTDFVRLRLHSCGTSEPEMKPFVLLS